MMTIAVPSRQELVDDHFGHCEAFTLFTVDDHKTIVSQELFAPPAGCGCKSSLIPDLVAKGVNVLVAGHMGQGAVDKLRQSGIQVCRGASGPVKEAVQAWLEGRLQDRQEVCLSHAGHSCSHGH